MGSHHKLLGSNMWVPLGSFTCLNSAGSKEPMLITPLVTASYLRDEPMCIVSSGTDFFVSMQELFHKFSLPQYEIPQLGLQSQCAKNK